MGLILGRPVFVGKGATVGARYDADDVLALAHFPEISPVVYGFARIGVAIFGASSPEELYICSLIYMEPYIRS